LYHHLRGTLVELGSLDAVVETGGVEAGGVGWQLTVPLSTAEALRGSRGQEVLVYTHLLVREDDLRLFGFATLDEREAFRLLLSVSRMGPAIAIQALSGISVGDLVGALASGDSATLCRIKGVGKKLAERLVLELREKAGLLLHRLGVDAESSAASKPSAGGEGERAVTDVVVALTELGYAPKEAQRRADDAWSELSPDGETNDVVVSVEALLREALRQK